MKKYIVSLMLWSLVLTSASAYSQTAEAAPVNSDSKAAETRARLDADQEKKAEEWVNSLNLTDAAKETRLKQVIATHLKTIRDWHNAHPPSTVPAGINPATGNKLSDLDRQVIANSAMPKSVHENLMTGLRKDLTEEQVELILDKYTIGKVAFTMAGYKAIVPNLTAAEEATILAFLRQAREQAVDYKNMKQISAIFEIYKTKGEQYLNNNGRNWKQMYKDYTNAVKVKKAAEKANGKTSTRIATTGKWSERMALSVLKRNPWMKDTTGASWGYTQGLIYYSLEQLWRKSNNKQYLEYIKLYAGKMIDNDGSIGGFKREDFNLDNINAGKILFNLYAASGTEKYKKALDRLREQLKAQPRTKEGGYWHKQKYTSQMWLDGAYMASPFLAQYAALFNEPQSFDEVALQFILLEKHLRDAKTGLLYHGWDESRSMVWANKQTGASPNFWGRAMGWYAMAIVDALDYFPAHHPKRAGLIQIFSRLNDALLNYQDKDTGLWYQVIDQGNRRGNYLEASASAMFVYAMAKGARKGYLDEKFLNAAKSGYDGIINRLMAVRENGEVDLLQVCEVAGLSEDRDGSYEYYVNEKIRVNDPKGTGPFILASLELDR